MGERKERCVCDVEGFEFSFIFCMRAVLKVYIRVSSERKSNLIHHITYLVCAHLSCAATSGLAQLWGTAPAEKTKVTIRLMLVLQIESTNQKHILQTHTHPHTHTPTH